MHLALDKLRPGDIILSRKKGNIKSHLIRWLGHTEYSHAEIVLSNFLRFEAATDGLKYYFPQDIKVVESPDNETRVYEALDNYDEITVLRHEKNYKYQLIFKDIDELRDTEFVMRNRYTAFKLYIFSLGYHAFSYPNYKELVSLIKNSNLKKGIQFLFPHFNESIVDHKLKVDSLIGDYCSKLAVNAVYYALFNNDEYTPDIDNVTPDCIKTFGFFEINDAFEEPNDNMIIESVEIAAIKTLGETLTSNAYFLASKRIRESFLKISDSFNRNAEMMRDFFENDEFKDVEPITGNRILPWDIERVGMIFHLECQFLKNHYEEYQEMPNWCLSAEQSPFVEYMKSYEESQN